MDVAIITARGGSESIKNKNLLEVSGKPLLQYQIEAAKDSEHVDEVFISTDGEKIAEKGRELECKIIDRPPKLQGDSDHGDVIKHAVETADERLEDLERATILLGNTAMVDGELIDLTFDAIIENDADSSMTVWKAEDDHPMRAMTTNGGFLEYYKDEYDASNTNRQNYDDIYFYDNGPWTLEKGCVKDRNGPGPWWWMGQKCAPVERVDDRKRHPRLLRRRRTKVVYRKQR
jgi:N-acylneuraminate cytidylyltransferase